MLAPVLGFDEAHLPPGAPEIERRVYAHEVMHFDVAPEKAAAGDTGLKQWSQGRSGKRRGPKTRFPLLKSRHRGRVSCRFTTGAIRVGDRMHVVVPRIGRTSRDG